MFLQGQYSLDLTNWTTVNIGDISFSNGSVMLTISKDSTSLDLLTVQIPVSTNTRLFTRSNMGVD